MACKFKVGDKVRANEKSNDRYSITNLRRECEGIVVNVLNDHKIRIKVTFSEYTWAIGTTYDVNDEYFDLISNNTEHDKNELHITVKGRETIAVYKHDGKIEKAVAKCSPQDVFDFATGVKLVCERLGMLPTPTESVKPTKQIHTGQYKIGDRVVVEGTNINHHDGSRFEGLIGTIDKIWETGDGYPYRVKLDGEYILWCSVKCLVKEKKPTPKPYTGKMICIKSGCDWWTVGKIYNVVNGKVESDDGDIYPKGGELYTSADDCRHMGSHESNKVNLANEFIPIVE